MSPEISLPCAYYNSIFVFDKKINGEMPQFFAFFDCVFSEYACIYGTDKEVLNANLSRCLVPICVLRQFSAPNIVRLAQFIVKSVHFI